MTRAQLLHWVGRAETDRILASGMLRRAGRGRYVLHHLDEHAAAHALTGVMVLTSAALAHGWPVAHPPRRPQVAVPRHRTVHRSRCAGIDLRFWDVESDGLATTPVQTVIDCARHLPFLDAVCVADSALRSRMVTPHELVRAAERCPRTGRARALAVAAEADGRADNPFESATRVLSREVAGLHLVPQQLVPGVGRVDLMDRRLGLVVECDSFTFHAHRDGLTRDIERYNALGQAQLPFVRFGWEHTFLRPSYVHETLRSRVDGLAVGPRCPACAA